MNKAYRKILSCLVIVPLLFALFMCCCTKQTFAASNQKAKSCHSQSDNDKNKPQPSSECQCDQILAEQSHSFLLADALTSYFKKIVKNDVLAQEQYGLSYAFAVFIDRSPPELLSGSVVPIFIRHSILRI